MTSLERDCLECGNTMKFLDYEKMKQGGEELRLYCFQCDHCSGEKKKLKAEIKKLRETIASNFGMSCEPRSASYDGGEIL